MTRTASNGHASRIDILVRDDGFARRLARELAATPELRAVPYAQRAAAYDATFMSLGMAERWGSKPLIEELQVLETGPEDRRRGLPPYIITGFVLRERETPRLDQLRIWASLMPAAMRQRPELARISVDGTFFDVETFSPRAVAEALVSGWRSGQRAAPPR